MVVSTIQSIGSAVPENRIDQRRIADFMAQAHDFDAEEKKRLEMLYRASGISQRHSVIDDYASLEPEDWHFYPKSKDLRPFPSTADRSLLYRKHALDLSMAAVKNCLQGQKVQAHNITHLITVSCTGMYAPGLDIDLVKELGISTKVQRTSINFMGCYAAMTGIKAAHAICQANPEAQVLLVATELCTIHFQNKKDPDNLLANAIFSDGSAALLMNNDAQADGKTQLIPEAFHCDILTEGENDMAWNIGDFGFEMKLSAYVPELIKNGIDTLLKSLTKEVNMADVPHYAIHPGGKKILNVIEAALGIQKSDNQAAHDVLRHNGNMSSPTILFVLKNMMDNLNGVNKGEKLLSMAFGPGLTLESILFRIA